MNHLILYGVRDVIAASRPLPAALDTLEPFEACKQFARNVVTSAPYAVGGIAIFAGVRYCWNNFVTDEDIVCLRTMVQSKFMTESPHRYLRGEWQRKAELIEVKPTPGHSHGDSAAARTGASATIDAFIAQQGLEPYVVSQCARDSDHDGYHQWFIDKDVAFAPKNDEIKENHVVKMVDVDYYVDWQKWLRTGNPVLIYTFMPDEVKFNGSEYQYTLSADKVSMEVSGGRQYCHPLWNYSRDHVCQMVSWFPRPTWRVYSIDCKAVDRHHAIVFLNPISTITWFGWLSDWSGMTRRDFATNDSATVVNGFATDSGVQLSLGSVGSDGFATSSSLVRADLMPSIAIRLETSRSPCIADVERFLRNDKVDKAAEYAPVIYKALMHGIVKYDVAHRRGKLAPLRYNAIDGLVTDDGKELARSLHHPLLSNPDVVPNRSYNNDCASIQGRINKVLNNVVPPARYVKYAAEFAALVVPTAGAGFPLDIDEVIYLQDRPSQRQRSAQVMHWIGLTNPVSVKAFMKGESYGKISDPRNISTVGAEHTLRLSAYTYAFKRDVLVDATWYAPCKDLSTVADRVVELVSNFDSVVETDFSRFDGTISRWLREYVERAVYLRWIGIQHRQDLTSLLDAEIDPHATTSNGLPYEPAASRLSGSPLTTDGNTLINAFVSYAAAREARTSPERAFDLLGIYAGDDGISPIKAKLLERASAHLGLRLKSATKFLGDVGFLGRKFWDARVSNVSIQDPERTLRKLHLTFAEPRVTDKQALLNKAAGLRITDPDTPIFREWCECIELTYPGERGEVDACASYAAYSSSRLGVASWPPANYQQGLEIYERETRWSAADIVNAASKLDALWWISDLDSHILENEPLEVGIPAAVDGEVLVPDDVSVATEPAAPRRERLPKSRQSRRDRARAKTPARGRDRRSHHQ